MIIRMWNVPVSILCRKHLLGEHVECHMMASHLMKKGKIDNMIINNLIEPSTLIKRHDELATEMLKRGYKHRSPIINVSINYLPKEQQKYKIDADLSLKDLLERCTNCKLNFSSSIIDQSSVSTKKS